MLDHSLITYFSYGHNTNIAEMHDRIPDARLMGAANLPDYRFRLEHFANIVPEQGSVVQGVLWGIPADEIKKLDYDEAYRTHYRHAIVEIRYHGDKVKALTYVMLPNYNDLRIPDDRYLRWITQGYEDNRIPLQQLIDAVIDRTIEISNLKRGV